MKIFPGILYCDKLNNRVITIEEFLNIIGFQIIVEILPLADIMKMSHGCCNPKKTIIYEDSNGKLWYDIKALYGIMKEWNKTQEMYL